MHGAGTAKREREGTRQNPKTAPIKHGQHAQPETKALLAAIDPAFAEDLQIFLGDKAKLRDLDTLLAFAWATLHRVSRETPEVAMTKLGEQPPAIVATLSMLTQTLEKVARIEWKIRQSSAPTLTVAQAQRLVRGLVGLLHEHVAIDRIDDAVGGLRRLVAAILGGDADRGGAPAAEAEHPGSPTRP